MIVVVPYILACTTLGNIDIIDGIYIYSIPIR